MSDELIAKIIEIGGWDTAKKLEEKMREEQQLQNEQQHYADEEEGLLDEIQFWKIRFSIFAQHVL